MRPSQRWPLHPAPIEGEALSSWLRRIAGQYQMTVAELLEHGLGQDATIASQLDLNPPRPLLNTLAQRTATNPDRLQTMCLAGWTPWLLDSLDAHPDAFDTYTRQHSVLLDPRRRSTRRAHPWIAWLTGQRVQRACPLCAQDPTRRGLRLIWQLPLTLSCPDHRLLLEQCTGILGEDVAWTDRAEPRAASEAVLAMDHRTEQALTTGRVELPARPVHAGVWLRLLRTLVDEISTPVSDWGTRGRDLRLIWDSCGHPLRAGITAWRPHEALPWPIQAQLLAAAAHAIRLLEHRKVTGRGLHAQLFAPPADAPVDAGLRPARKPKTEAERLELLRISIDDAVTAAREDPADAQRLYRLVVYGCRTPESVERLHRAFAELGIPTAGLSRDPSPTPFA